MDGSGYEHPINKLMLETTCEFLDDVECGSNTSGFGISLGGGVLYYVAHARPDVIKRSVLVSPAIASCIDKNLLGGILDGTNNFFCFESRHNGKLLFRDLTTGNGDTSSRKKKDPIPKFFYKPLYRRSQRNAPKGHYKALFLSLINSVGLDSSDACNNDSDPSNVDPFGATVDIDTSAHRLVIWPEKDRLINFELGTKFFQVGSNPDGTLTSKSRHTIFESIPECGHLFDAYGKIFTDIICAQVREYLLSS
jgi:pimeloyl-ACP methyl ester carboxylesterase